MGIKEKRYILLICVILIASITISGCIQNNGKVTEKNKTTTEKSKITIPENNETINNAGNKYVNPSELRFIVVGDPHIKSTNTDSDRGNDRLTQIVNFVDTSNVDFVVLLGDIADDGKSKTYDVAKTILKNMTKPYYVIAGNHDIFVSPQTFESKFGPMSHIEYVKGYQLLFVGISDDKSTGKTILHWNFDFNKTNKSAPTLVFLHGPTVTPPADAVSCRWGPDFFGYGQSMQPELNKFPNLIAEYTGHEHYDTDQLINGVRYVTVDGLVNKAGGCELEGASDNVGYSDIKNGKEEFTLINYNEPFKDPFPN